MKIGKTGIAAIALLCIIAFILSLILFAFLFPQQESQNYSFKDISAKEAYQFIKNKPRNLLLLDVRTWQEYNASHIKWGDSSSLEAINIPHDKLLANLSAYGTTDCLLNNRKNDFLIVYCAVGFRSSNACKTLVCNPYANFSRVNNMIDGFQQYYLSTFANPLEANPHANATWDYSDTVVVDTASAPKFQCTTISAEDAYLMVTAGSQTYGFCRIAVDVRDSEKYDTAHIVNSTQAPAMEALNIHSSGGTDLLSPLAAYRTEPIILYCDSSCHISSSACQYLASKGFSKTYTIQGGIETWTQSGYPTVSVTK